MVPESIHTSPSTSTSFDFPYFSDAPQNKIIDPFLHNQTILKSKKNHRNYFTYKCFEFMQFFVAISLQDFICCQFEPIYPHQVKVFFTNMSYKYGFNTSQVCITPISLLIIDFGGFLGIPSKGTVISSDDPGSELDEEFDHELPIHMCSVDLDVGHITPLNIRIMYLTCRPLLHVVTSILVLSKSNITQLFKSNIVFLWLFMKKCSNKMYLLFETTYEGLSEGQKLVAL